ncbi:MAG: PhoH family protein [Planctomycetota bacterium]
MQRQIELQDDAEAVRVFGIQDRHLKLLREHFGVDMSARGQSLLVEGGDAEVEKATVFIERMVAGVREGGTSPEGLVEELLSGAAQVGGVPPAPREAADFGRIARTPGQLAYLETISRHDLVLAIGPAGTGKTYLAVRMAVEALKAGEVRKLVLCRPAVEAGEKLGFLPGGFEAKINPYLRPLYDALNELLDYDQIRRYSDREIIEIVPLAYMRGRTLNQSFIILDEGQNTTPAQMKMFLTRMGMESRIVVTGDITQVDLPRGQPSGLIHARRVLTSIRGLRWVELTRKDIVRNPLVTEIVKAYEHHEGGGEGSGKKQRRGRPR